MRLSRDVVFTYDYGIRSLFYVTRSNKDLRDALAVQFNHAAHKKEFLIALKQSISYMLWSTRFEMSHRESDIVSKCMNNVGAQFAFYACVDVPEVGLKANALTRWVTAIDWPSMAQHSDRPLWQNQAAVFSHLTYSETARGDAPCSAIPHPVWIHEKRQILQNAFPDVDSLSPVIHTAARLPLVLSKLSAQYAAPDWDDCLARLQAAEYAQ